MNRAMCLTETLPSHRMRPDGRSPAGRTTPQRPHSAARPVRAPTAARRPPRPRRASVLRHKGGREGSRQWRARAARAGDARARGTRSGRLCGTRMGQCVANSDAREGGKRGGRAHRLRRLRCRADADAGSHGSPSSADSMRASSSVGTASASVHHTAQRTHARSERREGGRRVVRGVPRVCRPARAAA